MRLIQKGSTSISVDVYIIDSTDGTPELGVLFSASGMDLEYRREGAAVVDITEVTLAALTTGWTTGGFLEIGHGLYRLDVPDLAFATGANTVSIQGTVTGMIILPQTIQLVDFDPEDAVRLGLTSLPNVVVEGAGGLYTRGTGAGQINQDANGRIDVNVEGYDTGDVPVPAATGVPDVNPTHWLDGVIPAQGITGVPNVNITHQVDTVVPAPNTAGIPDVNVLEWADGAIPAQSITGVPEVDLTHVEGAATIPEPSAGVPPVTPGIAAWLGWLWAQWRNDSDVTSSERRVRNSSDTLLAKAPMTDSGSVYNPGEMEAP